MSDPYRTSDGPPRIIPRRSWRWTIYAIAFILGGGLFRSVGTIIYSWLKAPKPCVTTITYPAPGGCGNTYECSPNASMEILSNGAILCRCK